MSGKKGLLIIGGVTFLAALVALLPARVAYQLLPTDSVRLSGISGTIWNGRAVEGQVDRIYLRNIEWRLRPLRLMVGQVALDTKFEPAGGFVESRVALQLGGKLVFSNLEAALSIGALQSAIPTAGIDGNVRLSFSHLIIDNGFPTEADGSVELIGLIARGLTPTPIGNFKADLQSTDDGVSGSVEDTAAILDIAGSLKVSADRSYSLTGLVAATPATPEGVVNQLRFLGSPNERGQREFRFEGQL